jgi:hypothetical protein
MLAGKEHRLSPLRVTGFFMALLRAACACGANANHCLRSIGSTNSWAYDLVKGTKSFNSICLMGKECIRICYDAKIACWAKAFGSTMYKGIMIHVSLHHIATSPSISQELSFTAAIDFLTIRVHPL